MSKYDSLRHNPPAPIATVALRNATSGAAIDELVLLLDTGADVTLIPRTAIERLGVKPLADLRYELERFHRRSSAI